MRRISYTVFACLLTLLSFLGMLTYHQPTTSANVAVLGEAAAFKPGSIASTTPTPSPTMTSTPTMPPPLLNSLPYDAIQCAPDGTYPSPTPTATFTPSVTPVGFEGEVAADYGGGGYGGGGGGGGGGYGYGDIDHSPFYQGIPTPEDMFFQDYGVNPFLDTEDDPLSTFAMDVDTASYTITRTYLEQYVQMPPPAAIRPEEFINYFEADYPQPADPQAAFSLNLEAAPAPFGFEGHYLLRVGIQGRNLNAALRDPMFLVFVIDVSGSMQEGGRLELVKESLYLLLDQLRPDDYVGIVIYTDDACTLQLPLPASDKDTIRANIAKLHPQNSTNAQAGLEMGYDMAEAFRSDERPTRVILLSDGVANVDVTTPEGILKRIQAQVDLGITLTSIGVGMGNYNDVLLEQLANDGDGNYFYVDSLREAKRVFVNNLTGTLQVLARDAKIQVEFDPAVTDRYRLIGYENRALADDEFRDDAVDAGEIGMGHSITALYEIALEEEGLPADAVAATVYIRYQDAQTGEVVELSQPLAVGSFKPAISRTTPSFRLHAAAAEFAELLRQSYWAQEGSYAALLEFAQPLAALYPQNEQVQELLDLIERARDMEPVG